ncbi:sulfur carrier protein ThiS [Candidatus Electronema sp. JC]|uniref:sulfur carrier protein ThiS n=1 Tax=Candidatus Electronema sp. JC TaxID=3401570 RepID=UPI003AA9330E
MEIRLNGEPRCINAAHLTVAGLLEMEQVPSPEMVAVQIDGQIVHRCAYHDTMVGDRNQVDLLYFMAGG